MTTCPLRGASPQSPVFSPQAGRSSGRHRQPRDTGYALLGLPFASSHRAADMLRVWMQPLHAGDLSPQNFIPRWTDASATATSHHGRHGHHGQRQSESTVGTSCAKLADSRAHSDYCATPSGTVAGGPSRYGLNTIDDRFGDLSARRSQDADRDQATSLDEQPLGDARF